MDARVLELLRCPACAGAITRQAATESLCCAGCQRIFPIAAGIPNLLFLPDATSDEGAEVTYERDVHDARSDEYEETTVRQCGDKSQLLAERWAANARGRILDFGTGTGQVTRVLCRRHQFVVGVDISASSLARNMQETGVIGLVANGYRLPFRDGAFDTLCCNGVLHHMGRLPDALREMARVTQERMFISEPALRQYHRHEFFADAPSCSRRWASKLARGLLGDATVERLKRWRTGPGGAPPPAARQFHAPSKRQHALDPYLVAAELQRLGFRVTLLRLWTNIGWGGRSALKRACTRALVSQRRGNVFELWLERT